MRLRWRLLILLPYVLKTIRIRLPRLPLPRRLLDIFVQKVRHDRLV